MRLIDTLRDHLRQRERQVRYLLAGGANTLVGLGIYPLMLSLSPWLERHYQIALAISQLICVAFAFSTYKIGVFRTRANIWREFGYFSSFYYLVFAVNQVVLPALVEWAEWRPIPAQLVFSVVVLVGSYLWHSAVTFRSRAR